MFRPEDILDGMTPKQHVWDDFARWSGHRIARNPGDFVVEGFPYHQEPWGKALIECLGPLNGKDVLDVGCGLGYLSVYTARSGAKVSGIDLRLKMILAACSVAEINVVRCRYVQANTSILPFANDSFDTVVGVDILHHLSRPDLVRALSEVYRVLREGGKGIFVEPVENSRVFNFVQNLVPAGRKHSGDYRPSCLCPRAWASYVSSQDGRDLSTKELVYAGQPFTSVAVKPFGLLNRLERYFRNSRVPSLLNSVDHFVLKVLPFLTKYSRQVLLEYQK